jgi:hypothetical protein
MAAFPRPTAFAVAFVLFALTACSTASTAPTSSITPVAPAPDAPSTRVHLAAHDGARSWRGAQTISFSNPGAAPLDAIWLRLWANGVGGCQTQAVRIDRLRGGTVTAVRRACTAVRIELDTPVASGERGSVSFVLTIDVPRRNDRFGTNGGLTNMGGALPVLAIRDDSGWHLDPYVAIGESFYSVVGDYRVRLTTATSLRVAATGVRASQDTVGGRITRTYVARDVRDFMWSVGDLRSLVADAGPTRVRVWYRDGVVSIAKARAALADAVTSMRTFAGAFGAYPYPEVDVVLAGFRTFGGMEYPQLVLANPTRDVVAHELAHQWWWVTVGSDQYAAPWLDESLATWSQTLPFHPWTRCSGYDWPSPTARITNDMAYWAAHPKEYATIYSGGGCMFADLAHHLGLRPFTRMLARYQAAHRLGLAGATDLLHQVEVTAARVAPGFDLAAFWTRWRVG